MGIADHFGSSESPMMTKSTVSMLEAIRARADKAGVFAECRLAEGRLECRALNAAEEAWYRIEPDSGRWYVSLVTPDRWLSESIEADLMHFGDPIEELIEEELIELGMEKGRPKVEHYRSDDMLYTFRTPLKSAEGDAAFADEAGTYLLAYEAAFRELGDMDVDEEDEL